jgi:peptide/nickel transport system substrate-binding protein
MALAMTAAMAGQLAADPVNAQGSTPVPAGTGRPAVNTGNQTRGEGGELRIIQWQAPSHLGALQAIGEKDGVAASLVSESLMVRGPQGQLIPNLVTAVPTVENGMLAGDLASVTFDLLPGVLWSDGEPFTAADVAFTLEWILDRTINPSTEGSAAPGEPTTNGAVMKALYETVASYTVNGDTSITITFTQPNPAWSDGYTGAGRSVIYPKHILAGGGQEAMDAFLVNPIGTGPYKVEEFIPNDRVVYTVNDAYREPTKPYFNRVVLSGGGDAGAAARAVVQVGDFDYGWNMAIEPELATSLSGNDTPGVLLVAPSLGIERININFSDPRVEVDGQRSEMHTPHPILSDRAVRQSMNLAIDRQLIANSFFFGGQEEPAVENVLSGVPIMAAPGNRVVFDPDEAVRLLEAAGWVMDGEVRRKDGQELALTFQATINQVRQKVQQVVKSNLEAIGFRIDLVQTDASVFFDRAAGNDQGYTSFPSDLNMVRSSVGALPPVAYMLQWYAGDDGKNIAQASNGWTGRNVQRYSNAEYDEVFRQALVESDPDEQAALFIALNDLLLQDVAVLPLVRVRNRVAVARTLNQENLALSPYEWDYWNIVNWNRGAG